MGGKGRKRGGKRKEKGVRKREKRGKEVLEQSRKKQKGKQIYRGLLCYLSSQEKPLVNKWRQGMPLWGKIRKGFDFPFSFAIARRVLYSD